MKHLCRIVFTCNIIIHLLSNSHKLKQIFLILNFKFFFNQENGRQYLDLQCLESTEWAAGESWFPLLKTKLQTQSKAGGWDWTQFKLVYCEKLTLHVHHVRDQYCEAFRGCNENHPFASYYCSHMHCWRHNQFPIRHLQHRTSNYSLTWHPHEEDLCSSPLPSSTFLGRHRLEYESM